MTDCLSYNHSEYESYWIGANYVDSWSWYSAMEWSWMPSGTTIDNPPTDERAIKASISNNHAWSPEKHDDVDTKFVGLCEKIVGKP